MKKQKFKVDKHILTPKHIKLGEREKAQLLEKYVLINLEFLLLHLLLCHCSSSNDADYWQPLFYSGPDEIRTRDHLIKSFTPTYGFFRQVLYCPFWQFQAELPAHECKSALVGNSITLTIVPWD